MMQTAFRHQHRRRRLLQRLAERSWPNNGWEEQQKAWAASLLYCKCSFKQFLLDREKEKFFTYVFRQVWMRIMLTSVINVLIIFIIGDSEADFYSSANKTLDLMMMINITSTFVFSPFIYQIMQMENERGSVCSLWFHTHTNIFFVLQDVCLN